MLVFSLVMAWKCLNLGKNYSAIFRITSNFRRALLIASKHLDQLERSVLLQTSFSYNHWMSYIWESVFLLQFLFFLSIFSNAFNEASIDGVSSGCNWPQRFMSYFDNWAVRKRYLQTNRPWLLWSQWSFNIATKLRVLYWCFVLWHMFSLFSVLLDKYVCQFFFS